MTHVKLDRDLERDSRAAWIGPSTTPRWAVPLKTISIFRQVGTFERSTLALS